MHFYVAGDDFGIDSSESGIELAKRNISVDVTGSAERFSQLSEGDDSPWAWALYPPRFYLFVEKTLARTAKLRLEVGDLANCECALYWMEHNPVLWCELQRDVDAAVIVIQGESEIIGERQAFRIEFPPQR